MTYLTDLDCHLYIYGNSNDLARPHINSVERLGIDKVVTIRNDLTFKSGLKEELSQRASLALGGFGNSAKAKAVTTNKLIEAMNLGIPVLSGHAESIDELIPQDVVKTCARDSLSLSMAIRDLYGKKDILQEQSNNGKVLFESKFSYNAFEKNLDQLFEQRV